MVIMIVANIVLVYLAICFLVSMARTIGAKREEWHVYNGQGMSFGEAFVRYFIEDISVTLDASNILKSHVCFSSFMH